MMGRRARCIDGINPTIYHYKNSHSHMIKSHDWLVQLTPTPRVPQLPESDCRTTQSSVVAIPAQKPEHLPRESYRRHVRLFSGLRCQPPVTPGSLHRYFGLSAFLLLPRRPHPPGEGEPTSHLREDFGPSVGCFLHLSAFSSVLLRYLPCLYAL